MWKPTCETAPSRDGDCGQHQSWGCHHCAKCCATGFCHLRCDGQHSLQRDIRRFRVTDKASRAQHNHVQGSVCPARRPAVQQVFQNVPGARYLQCLPPA